MQLLIFCLFFQQVKLEKSDVDLDLELLEEAASLAIKEQQSPNQVAAQNPSSPHETPCTKCSPTTKSTPQRNNLDESFPKADLDLASSTDSCSSSSEDSESDSETDSESEEEQNVANLSVISEETSINTSQEHNQEQTESDINVVTSGIEKLKVDKQTEDSTTLNFWLSLHHSILIIFHVSYECWLYHTK